MTHRLALVLAGAFCVSALMVGPVQAVCDPYCSPKSNEGGKWRGQERADWVHDYKNGGGGTGGDPGTTPPPDRDGDLVPDDQDRCPDEKALTADGCPVPDGF
jgi:hypothetical protein